MSVAVGAVQAQAQDAPKPTVAFNAGVFSDYAFRGVSQTDEKPAIQGGADVSAGQVYAGVWASNVDFNDATDAEVDLYAGFKPILGPVALDLGVIYYGYVNAPSGADYANWEVKVAGSVPVGKGSLGAAVFYSPDSFGAADEATYYEANGSYPLSEKVSMSAAVGRQTYKGPGDYTTWNVGATWAFAPHLAADLRYHDTNEHGFGKIYGSRAVVSLKATF
ncbi:TorF family putative porin (plasmid) [Phenylobacterium sp. LH3H17]|uniref:TorF family putative porin n=1 Tax=Phenylobacterium sp. LH3H17 TaxID=2903901 RepID=UPI0020C979F6|nr:TorF family putative porin [Phenylobacterium sp. LH3H17]UTP41708.1 TorF family putative porin [Phenylobacterium sp. LH3H17]